MIKILKNKLSKKVIISLILVGFIAVGSTLAYLFDISGLVTNTFSRASIHTEIEEDTAKTDLTKNPSVINTDVTDALVRVRLSISSDEDVNGQSIFEKYFGLAGIDCNYAVTEELTGENNEDYWKRDPNDDRYNCYYYYKKVLKGTDEAANSPYKTEPLFDKIMKKNDNGDYTSFYNENGALIDYEDKTILQYLNDIEITIYQESVPVSVITKDGRKLNADPEGTGDVNIEEAKEIFAYFESNPSDTESNN